MNCGYHPYVSFEKNTNSHFRSKLTDELLAELRDLIIICQKKLYHISKFQKQANKKCVKPKSYALSDQV